MQFEEIIEGCVAYAPNWMASDIGHMLFNHLVADVTWRQEHMTFGGGTKVPLPRLVAWYGDPGARYFYSGIHNEPLPWSPELASMRDRCTALFPDHPFNSVLINWYRDGNDSIGYHVDNERDLINNSTIATVSLGGPRTFHLKSKHGSGEVTKVKLEHGSLLLMYGECQKNWLHGIPKEPELVEPRISLTFRTVHIR